MRWRLQFLPEAVDASLRDRGVHAEAAQGHVTVGLVFVAASQAIRELENIAYLLEAEAQGLHVPHQAEPLYAFIRVETRPSPAPTRRRYQSERIVVADRVQ